jgi:hypothetical protein
MPSRPYPALVLTVAAMARPVEKSSIPVVTTPLLPNHSTSFDDSVADTIIAPA